MKSKILSLLFSLLVIAGYSQVQIPNIGTGPDTKTGTKLRDAMIIMIDNDTTLNNRIDSLVAVGSGWKTDGFTPVGSPSIDATGVITIDAGDLVRLELQQTEINLRTFKANFDLGGHLILNGDQSVMALDNGTSIQIHRAVPGILITDSQNSEGLVYDADYSANYGDRNIPDVGYVKTRTLEGSATLNFPSTTNVTVSRLTITVTGALDGDPVSLGIPNAAVTTTGTYSAWVSASNTVTVQFSPKATEDPASAVFKVTVHKP